MFILSNGARKSYSYIFIAPDPSGSPKMASTSGGPLRKRIYERYKVIGFISSGTYGRVYKAQGKSGQIGEFAIKKFVSCMLPML